MRYQTLWIDVHLATMTPGGAAYGAIEDGAIAVDGERIAFVGPRAALPGAPDSLAARVHRCGGRWMTPGLVDCHTHLVHAGDRARDFEMRCAGAGRDAILAAGGGIPSTVRATRAADEQELLAQSEPRLRALLAEGVTTVEIKSGYGLDVDTEMRQLRVARALGERHPVTVVTSHLGSHGLAPEYQGRPEEYVRFVADEALPRAAREGLVDMVDSCVEQVAFSPRQIEPLYRAAAALGLPIRAHTDQYADAGGAAAVARHGGACADHLEYASREGVEAMAAAGTVAVLLPGANYVLRETRRPPVAWLRECGVPMALATNCNPGSSPVTSLLLMLNMGCTLFGMTAEEAVAGVTREGARALGLGGDRGTLEAGKRADLVLWDIERPAELAYRLGHNPCQRVIRGGEALPSPPAL